MEQNCKRNYSSLFPTALIMLKQPKIAIFYDWLNQWGGAEKVLLDILEIYPDAPIYTLVHDPKKTNWIPKNKKIITSWINNLPFSSHNPIIYTPLYGIALESLDFSQFDIILSTTSINGHCFITPANSIYICYFHNINRYLYQTPKQFLFLKPLLKIYQKVDYIFGQRPDFLMCNSKTVQQRIKKIYNRDSQIIYPGINTGFFKPAVSINNTDNKYFLIVSRLVVHKRIDIAIKACQKLNLDLIIVGSGRNKKNLQKLLTLNSKVKFVGKANNFELLNLYQNCLALICPQEEDFGLTPLEANACGKPVIAYQKGGITETIVDGKTGAFFKEQTETSLIKTLQNFDSKYFLPIDCVNNANKFSKNNFMLNLKQSITNLWLQKQKTTSL